MLRVRSAVLQLSGAAITQLVEVSSEPRPEGEARGAAEARDASETRSMDGVCGAGGGWTPTARVALGSSGSGYVDICLDGRSHAGERGEWLLPAALGPRSHVEDTSCQG